MHKQIQNSTPAQDFIYSYHVTEIYKC
uniref:Uncharacterized protein n=1 Tax=Rhizophora mucronata TaxID=61149 RepID=A0A2P2J1I7_RHIMU